MSDNIPLGGNLGVKVALNARASDGKCYFPCNRCRGYNRRRILIKKTKKHCTEHEQPKVGNEYCPMVSYYLNIFIFQYYFCKYLYVKCRRKIPYSFYLGI